MLYLLDHVSVKPFELDRWVRDHHAVVVDARKKSTDTHNPHWQKPELQAMLGDNYLHLPNVLAEDGPESRKQMLRLLLKDRTVVAIPGRLSQVSLIEREAIRVSAAKAAKLPPDDVTYLDLARPAIDKGVRAADLMSSAEAREYLSSKGYDASLVNFRYHLHKSKHLARVGIKIGRAWGFTREGLDEFLEVMRPRLKDDQTARS
jgi:hypothetical protein